MAVVENFISLYPLYLACLTTSKRSWRVAVSSFAVIIMCFDVGSRFWAAYSLARPDDDAVLWLEDFLPTQYLGDWDRRTFYERQIAILALLRALAAFFVLISSSPAPPHGFKPPGAHIAKATNTLVEVFHNTSRLRVFSLGVVSAAANTFEKKENRARFINMAAHQAAVITQTNAELLSKDDVKAFDEMVATAAQRRQEGAAALASGAGAL
jgi:hypothetical protein